MTTTISFFLECRENLLLLLLLLLLLPPSLLFFSSALLLPRLDVASSQVFLLPPLLSARSTSKAPHRMREHGGCEFVCSSRALPLVVRSRSLFEAAREHRLGNKWDQLLLPN